MSDPESTVKQIIEIFFLSSERQDFSNPNERQQFGQRWTEFYLEQYRHEIFVAMEGDKVCGYLMGCSDSNAAKDYFKNKLPSQLVFEDFYSEYPSHFHINLHPEFRSSGRGSVLLTAYCDYLAEDTSSRGVHIITSPSAGNVKFYQKNQFQFQLERPWKQYALLFMGRIISR